jgi:hypothetical protein
MFKRVLENDANIRDSSTHKQLKKDLSSIFGEHAETYLEFGLLYM